MALREEQSKVWAATREREMSTNESELRKCRCGNEEVDGAMCVYECE